MISFGLHNNNSKLQTETAIKGNNWLSWSEVSTIMNALTSMYPAQDDATDLETYINGTNDPNNLPDNVTAPVAVLARELLTYKVFSEISF